MTYQDKKAEIRQSAIEWQMSWDGNEFSYGELARVQAYFEKYGRRYGLLREFRENGIC